jgi:hypothetical protein
MRRYKLVLAGLTIGLFLSPYSWSFSVVNNGSPINQGQKTTKTSFSTEIANAYTYNQSADGCIIGNTKITVKRDNQAKTVTAIVSIDEVDQCNGGQDVEIAAGKIQIGLSDFTVDPKFNTETAKGSGTIFDQVTQQNITFSFNLTWTGDGDIWRDYQTDDFRSGSSSHVYTTDNRTGRDASVTGTIESKYHDTVSFFPHQELQHEDGTQTTTTK